MTASRQILTLGLTLGLVLAAAAPLLGATPLPYAKPGLWVIQQHMATGKTYSSKLCSDAASQAAMLRAGAGVTQACSRQTTSVSGAQVTVDAVCKLGPSTVTSRTVITYSGDSAFHVVSDGVLSPAFMGKTSTHTTIDARWTGACPAGVAPGDMILATGAKVNVLGSGH